MNVFRKVLGGSALVLACGFVGCAAQRSSESESAAPLPPATAAGSPASTQDAVTRDHAEPATLGRAEPATLEEAEAWLEKARSDLDRLALNDVPPPSSAAATAPAEAAAPTPAPAPVQKRAADKAAETAPSPRAPEKPSACETACKAFSSLCRASDAVCRLDSEGGQRCQRARQIQSDATRRIAGCGCSK